MQRESTSKHLYAVFPQGSQRDYKDYWRPERHSGRQNASHEHQDQFPAVRPMGYFLLQEVGGGNNRLTTPQANIMQHWIHWSTQTDALKYR